MTLTKTRNRIFYWDTVVLEVEDELFRVPRGELAEHSEVFADMFSLPSGPEGQMVEGMDDDHPIVLEGCKKKDFETLLKVMCPSARTMLLVTDRVMKVDMDKDEWLSVLFLATKWIMKKIRAHAIYQLSTTFTLSPNEKIFLAREHKVAKWLEEGINTIVEGKPKSAQDLASLGWETAARIFSMALHYHTSPCVTLAEIKCTKCSIDFSLFPASYSTSCMRCRSLISNSTPLRLARASKELQVSDILCMACRNHPWPSTSFRCNSCGYTVYNGRGYTQDVKVELGGYATRDAVMEENFGQELKDLRSAWLDS